MKRLIPLLLLMCATTAFAAPETFEIDGSHTFERFSYNHLGFSTQQSRFNKTSGVVVLDQKAKTGSVDVTVDINSVETGSVGLDEHLKGPDFFDVARYPTATFKSTKVLFSGDTPVAVDGNLTIKGVTKPVTLTVTHFKIGMNPIMKREAIGADATTTIKRSEFGLGKYVPMVGDQVTIDLSIEAQKH